MLGAMRRLGVGAKVAIVAALLGVVCCTIYSTYLYRREVTRTLDDARAEGKIQLERATEMFLVSTRKFHEEFNKAAARPEEQKRVLDDWIRTIAAVDEAVITDHGGDKPRVMLTGDRALYGFEPQGTKTRPTTDFEREAAQRLAQGEKFIEKIDGTHLRMAVPLYSQAHVGCAECHLAKAEGLKADMSRNVLLGSLNTYIPIEEKLTAASNDFRANTSVLVVAMTGMIGLLYLALRRLVIKPLVRCKNSVVALARRDFSKRCDVRSHDEIGQMAEAINTSADVIKGALDEVDNKVYFYESILNTIPHPVSVTDNEMHWTFVNKTALDIAGLKKEDVLGKHCSNWGADICNTQRCGICMAKAAGGKATSYFTQPAFPGMEFMVEAAIMQDRAGKPMGHIEVIQDITAQNQVKKYRENEVARLSQNLTELGKGNLDVELKVADANKYTAEDRENFLAIQQAMEKTVGGIRAMVRDANTLAVAATEGRLDVRADASQHHGEYRSIVEGLNRVFDSIVVPLQEAGKVLEAMAAKDFTRKVEGRFAGDYDVFIRNINEVAGSVKAAIKEIHDSANQFNEGAHVIAQGSQSLAQGAQTQSAGVEEMMASIEELTRSIEAVKESAGGADKLAQQTSHLAEDGRTAVQRSVQAMDLIRASSTQISEIIQVISEIASQTNLLALNAAIEAARAGEYGMGFAVVADEVRKLAERSNQAAREISTLIRESAHRVEEGTQLSSETGKALNQIIDGVELTASKIAEIASATVQQAANAEEISRAIQEVTHVTEENAAGSEEMASSSEELGAQASGLRELVGQFRTE